MIEDMNLESDRKAQAKPEWIKDALDRAVYDALGPLCAGLAAIFSAFTIINAFFLPSGGSPPLVLWDLAVVVFSLIVLLAFERGAVSPSSCNTIGMAAALLVQANILMGYHLIGSPVYIAYSVMVAIGAGCVVLSRPHLAAATAVVVAATLAVASIQVEAAVLVDYAITLFAASALSFTVHSARVRTFTRLARLHRHDEALKSALEETLAESEQELAARKKAESRYRDLVQDIDAIVWEADAQTWEFSFVSDHLERVLGYSAQEWMSNKDCWVESIHPDDRESAVAYCINSTQEGRDHVLEYRAVTKTGEIVWLKDIVRVVKDSDGKPRLLRGVMVDITESRKAEEERAHLVTQLQQSQKLEAIGTLAGGIAHDFNNLLAGIMGYADIIVQGEDLEPDIRKAGEVILQASTRASQLTKQLLGFARKGKHQSVRISLSDSVDEVADLLSRTIHPDVKINRAYSPGAFAVKGDPDQIYQMILNLAVNARDAMPAGGDLTFGIETVELDDEYCLHHVYARPGKYVKLSIRDTGEGMPHEVRDRIFEPFFTTKAPGKGTGMGLAMVYGIIKNHGGTIEVYSEQGMGTMFGVYLPLAEESGDLAIDTAAPAAMPHGSGMILLVDDEEMIRRMATTMLSSLGYQVQCASDGLDALEVYRNSADKIDLVILDMIMPHMNGPDCFRELKKFDPDVKAILSSGYSRDGAVQDVLDEGMLGFTQKPYRMRELAGLVASVLRDDKNGGTPSGA